MVGPLENQLRRPHRTVRGHLGAGEDAVRGGIPIVLEEQPVLASFLYQERIRVVVPWRTLVKAKVRQIRLCRVGQSG